MVYVYTFSSHFENYLRFLISFIMIIRSVLNTKSQVCAEEADNERWKVEGSGRGAARKEVRRGTGEGVVINFDEETLMSL